MNYSVLTDESEVEAKRDDKTVSENKSGQSGEVGDYGLVSIIMPNYNGSKYLNESISSVLSQTYKNWELIFVDDCSTDNSLDMVRDYNDDRIVIIVNEKNSGAAVSRNKAIDRAKGKWIAFLDNDDIWDKDKLLKHLSFMSEKNATFSCTDYYVFSSAKNKRLYSPKKDEYDYKAILKHNAIGCSTVIFNAEKIGKVYMPEEAVKREDFACWLQILKKGEKVICFREPLTYYRVGKNSVSSNKLKMIKYQWNVYRKIEKISFFGSIRYMFHWAINGFLKYKVKNKRK